MNDIQVFRGGSSRGFVEAERDQDARLSSGAKGVEVWFHSGARQKQSSFLVRIGPAAFAELAQAMINHDPKYARHAFLSAMLSERQNRIPKRKRRSVS